MNVKSIIRKYLKDKGFDGLVHPTVDCACARSEAPAGHYCESYGRSGECKPAYRHKCSLCACDRNECPDGEYAPHCYKTTKQETK